MTIVIDELKSAFIAYRKQPFLFAWGSFMYLFLFVVSIFAAFAIILAYFIFLSVMGIQFDLTSPITIGVASIALLLFMLFTNGLNAALSKTYSSAMDKERMSLTAFYAYALKKAPPMFTIMLFRDILWLVAVLPAIALYVFVLDETIYAQILIGGYALAATFVIHLLFTPAFIYSGAVGIGIFSAIRHSITAFRKKHIQFIGLYVLFAVVWLLNFIPFIQLATIFFAYPIIYSAMISMLEGAVKLERED